MMIMHAAHQIAHHGLRASLGLVVALLIAGCTTPDYQFSEGSLFNTPIDDKGYREKYPIGVKNVTTAVELPGKSGQERLTPAEIRQVSDIVSAFLGGRESQLVVAVPGSGAGDARVLGRAKQIGDLVKRRGVPASRMLLRVASDDTGANGPIVISYDTLVVTVPDCRLWDTESSHDETNTATSNFGCSLQRNIGLMIDNPRDLIEPRKTTATHDATRSGVVLDNYRAGKITGAVRGKIESAVTITAD